MHSGILESFRKSAAAVAVQNKAKAKRSSSLQRFSPAATLDMEATSSDVSAVTSPIFCGETAASRREAAGSTAGEGSGSKDEAVRAIGGREFGIHALAVEEMDQAGAWTEVGGARTPSHPKAIVTRPRHRLHRRLRPLRSTKSAFSPQHRQKNLHRYRPTTEGREETADGSTTAATTTTSSTCQVVIV